MTQLLFYGCLFFAYSPTIVFFLMVIARNSQLVIMSIGGSFFWLLSMLLASIWWYIIPPMRTQFWFVIPFTIAFQEAFRYLFFRLYSWGFNDRPSLAQIQSKINQMKSMKADQLQQQQQQPGTDSVINTRLETLSARPNHTLSSAAIGTGSGITYAFVMYGTIMWESQGPGDLFSPACPDVSLFMLSAIYALCFSLLHILWNVTAFQGYRTKNRIDVGIVLVSHIAISYFTMLNLQGGSCAGAIVPAILITLFMFVYTFRTMLRGDSITKIA
ncbi:hypothetical protein SAMD00019534_065600 [Acytostelium subglobosum LB1]|uniref:hypothetical protein n=1 Tax=Acytostelium subglobosum LB1 TaxID=1410327 RepID=UPI000644A1D0|nr:hypothetical protein SAMD00019534_065600 [Acytostelium subglobosum LB1]GAM23385.1 hypothetical protein SAMD00019534_065600 [Acytostelium subglobosum LB1]|eukprot:XP_012753834.1 hypothetical protein SAMD00019534_065600 [Acytostelium subglobosum LB1]